MNHSSKSNEFSSEGQPQGTMANSRKAAALFASLQPRLQPQKSDGSHSPFSLGPAQAVSRKSPAVIGKLSGLAVGRQSLSIAKSPGNNDAAFAVGCINVVSEERRVVAKGKESGPTTSPFTIPPPWMKNVQPNKRKIAPSVSLPAAERYFRRKEDDVEPDDLNKANSSRGSSRGWTVDDVSRCTEDLMSVTDFSQSYLDDFTETSSLATDYVREGVIAIGVLTPTRHDAPSQTTKQDQQDQDIISEVVAKDLAEQEHNLKIKRNGQCRRGERRLSSPTFTTKATSEDVAKRRARLSLRNNVEARSSFLESLKHTSSTVLEEPTFALSASAPMRMVRDCSTTTSPSSSVRTPRLFAHKSCEPVLTLSSNVLQDEDRSTSRTFSTPTRALPRPPASSRGIPKQPLETSVSTMKPAPHTIERAEDNDSDDSLQSDCKPPSLRSTPSADSGLELDEKTRNEIIRQSSSHAAVRRLSSVSDTAKKRTCLQASRSSPGGRHPPQGRALSECVDTTAPATVTDAPRARQGRPSDEKQNARISRSGTARRNVPNRPCDEKADFRRGVNASRPGAYAAGNALRDNKSNCLLLAAGDSRQPIESENDASFEPVTTSEVRAIDNQGSGDLEAQAGVPVLLPGAFAVSSTGQTAHNTASGYDSGFEDGSVSNAHSIEDAAVGAQQDNMPALRPDAPDTPVQAELYEEHVVDGLVLPPDDAGNVKGTRRSPFIKVGLGIFIVLVTIVAVFVSQNEPVEPRDDPSVPVLEGWSQLGSVLMGPTSIDNARFGFSIGMSGDGNRLAVGLPGADGNGNEELRGSGSVCIYDFNGTDWLKSYEIAGPGMHAGAGKSIALSHDGSRVAFAAPSWGDGGFIAVYEETSVGMWVAVGTVPTRDPAGQSRFGGSLDLSANGRVLAVSDKDADSKDAEDTGRVCVYEDVNKTWTPMGIEIKGRNGGDFLGWSVSLSGDGRRLAATALGVHDFAGDVTIFDFDGQSWVTVGSSLHGESSRENFGSALDLSLDGKTLAVGATGYSPDDGKVVGAGRVRVFRLEEDDEEDYWAELGDTLEGSSRFDAFGTSVALSATGNVVVIGGPENDNFGENSGHIKLFMFDGTRWEQLGSEVGAPKSAGGQFGFSLAVSADASRFAGASPFANFDGFVNDVGEVWVFNSTESG